MCRGYLINGHEILIKGIFIVHEKKERKRQHETTTAMQDFC